MVAHSRAHAFPTRHEFTIAAVLLCALLHASLSIAAVGRTKGSFDVSPSGSASYVIPIFTPPGPKGIQPSVALAYSSNGGVGYVGRGWSLAGFSSIERCNKSIAQDGAAAPVSLVAGDGYCLDGNRLKLQSGSYGGNSSVWATEVADFSRITATATGGFGPDSWSVERKDGTIWTYGTTTGSSVLVGSVANAWYVSQISDRVGNKVRFTYKSADAYTTGVTHPVQIVWTQTSAGSGSYVYSMDFAYTSNGNPAQSSYTGFVAGTEIRDTDLLESISVKSSSTTVRKYVLGYDASPTTGAKRLTSVTECSNAAASDCLAPTTIGYQNGQMGISATPSTTSSISGSATLKTGDRDYNGDGINDLAYYRDGAWYVRFGSTSGYGSEVATGVTEYLLLPFDPYGTGRSAILGKVLGPSWYYVWHAFYWNGTAFVSTSTGVTEPDTQFALLNAFDVNGDNRDDLVFAAPDGPYGGGGYPDTQAMGINVVPSTSTGSTISFGTKVMTSYVPYNVQMTGGLPYFDFAVLGNQGRTDFDLNGDGHGDLLASGLFYYWLYDAYWDTWYMDWTDFHTALIGWSDFQFYEAIVDTSGNGYAMSMNSDGCIDFYTTDQVMPSSCSGIGGTWYTAGPIVGATDWNGDKRQDLLVSISGTTYVQLSTGQGLSSPQATGIPNCPGVFADANGDSLDDYICRNGTTLQVYLRNDSTIQPDLATSFTDGYGVNQTVAYVFSTYTGYAAYGNASYPRVDITAPMVLARTVTSSDGIGGTYTMTYSYFGATEDPTRYGFEGFEKIEVVDSRNNVKLVQRFKREFPYGGEPYETSTYQSDGKPISSTVITMTSMTLDGTTYKERFYPYASASTVDDYEVGGSKNGDWITRTATSITMDSWGNTTASTKTVTDKDSSSPLYGHAWIEATSVSFSPDTANWCLSLPTASSVTYSATTGEATVTRSKSFTAHPNAAMCLMYIETVEPLSSTLRVDTGYGYDSFGNIDMVSVVGRDPAGIGMTARNTYRNWGTTGQFPVQETNALGQTTTRTFHSTFGSLLTESDPNGIVTSNHQYDSFGRLNISSLPDGTFVSYAIYNCAAISWCVPSSLAKTAIQTTHYSSSWSGIRGNWTWLDQFDRQVATMDTLIDGSDSQAITYYDGLGRVQLQSAPCLAVSCSALWTTTNYDLLNRITNQSRPRSQSDSTAVTTTFAYAGRTQTVTDPNSKISTKVIDVNGRMRRSRDHDGYGQNFAYDGAGSLIGVTDTASNGLFGAAYYYGIKPFQYSTYDMDLGYWGYTHNSLGELVAWSDNKSQSFSQTFDALSRVITRTDQNTGQGEGTTTFTFGTSAGSYNIGRLASVSMSGGSYGEALSYDSAGRMSTRSITADSNTYSIDYTYNGQGTVDTVTYPTSTSSTRVKVKYGYSYGILKSVTDWTSGSAGTVYWTANTQNPRGQITQETFGNGVVTNRFFDAVSGQLNTIQSGVSGGTGLQNHSYAYDDVGNVTQRQENTLGLTENFYYDNLYRLTSSQVNSNTAVTNAYDALGRVVSRSDVNGNATWSYDSIKQHAVTSTGSGGTSYGYDANGNMTSRGGATISWTSFNYLSAISNGTESSTFYYGPNRQYYRQDYSGPGATETTYYIGGLLEKVCSSASCISGTVDWRHNIVANGETVAIVSRKASGTNAVHYSLEDMLGSSSTLTDSGGSLVVRASYSAFGLPRDGSDWDGAASSGDQALMETVSSRGYTGHSMLGRMGLIHMNGRVQDAIIGRFLSPDPNIPLPGFTQSYNRYSYVDNNPLTYTDPSGFCATPGAPVDHDNDPCEELPENNGRSSRRGNYLPPECIFAIAWCVNIGPAARPQHLSQCQEDNNCGVLEAAQHEKWLEDAKKAHLEWLKRTHPPLQGKGPQMPPAPPTQSGLAAGSQVNSGIAAIAGYGEYAAGKSSISGNLDLYKDFKGNQYRATVQVSQVMRVVGAATVVGGFALDLAMVYNGEIGPTKMGVNTGAGLVGLYGGPLGAGAAVVYFGLEAAYPGGAVGALNDYSAIAGQMSKVDRMWNKL